MAETHLSAAETITIGDPERRLTLSYAPARARPGLAALWALDEVLGAILRGGREPIVAQMRLTWWHDALTRLDGGAPPAQPVLQALAEHVLPHGVTGAGLAVMIDGWEVLIDPDPIGDAALVSFAEQRGGVLFQAAGQVLGAAGDPLSLAGQGWALADLARHSSDPALAGRALVLARPLLEQATAARWSRAGRPIGMLSHLALIDAAAGAEGPGRQGSPLRLARMVWHAISGR